MRGLTFGMGGGKKASLFCDVLWIEGLGLCAAHFTARSFAELTTWHAPCM
jgi:hypothetical protein